MGPQACETDDGMRHTTSWLNWYFVHRTLLYDEICVVTVLQIKS